MKILVTGSNGLLGQHLLSSLLSSTEHEVIATGRGGQRTAFQGNDLRYNDLDITDGIAVHELIENEKPEMIIHTAALTRVDECELDHIGCWNINVTATRFLIDAAK